MSAAAISVSALLPGQFSAMPMETVRVMDPFLPVSVTRSARSRRPAESSLLVLPWDCSRRNATKSRGWVVSLVWVSVLVWLVLLAGLLSVVLARSRDQLVDWL